MRFLTTVDELERQVMARVAYRRLELAADDREDLALRTANAVWKAVKK